VICRCELVTEAEIEDAIDHGARTLDGIKFRSRAGMGRCQGGFCSSRCMQILSNRLNVPLEALSKRGGDSWLVTPMENAQHPQHDQGSAPEAMPNTQDTQDTQESQDTQDTQGGERC
ncbi:MAG: (2Fe-2S)-binding protein, partial [Deltaproteobacteria bacterium]|nr:(2Fe-2S)-binding protein [Deltaproteobacteria bacterium]